MFGRGRQLRATVRLMHVGMYQKVISIGIITGTGGGGPCRGVQCTVGLNRTLLEVGTAT
ncbi:hypothetical protein KCP74_03335 [Salmonella enterica subsp. enterica]|nr:hypothetical protein KCP74_03335 [Salmonella enterica subsp. enterica]